MNCRHFAVHTDHGNIVVKKNDKGMPYIDLAGVDGEVALNFVQTVWGNMEGFTRREVEVCERRSILSQSGQGP